MEFTHEQITEIERAPGIMDECNYYSKTNLDVTFMRKKENAVR